VTLTTDGNDHPVLHCQDPNDPAGVTGYIVYRSPDPAHSKGSWTQVALDVVDADVVAPGSAPGAT